VGERGVEGKILASRYARERGIPYLGICLGLQVAVIDVARHLCGLQGAHSTEMVPHTPHPVIDFLPGQKDISVKGGTMRLGLFPCRLSPGSKAFEAYGEEIIHERHRHRSALNNSYRDLLESKGMRVSGTSLDGDLVEIVELLDHPWFVACQFHPEFRSRPNRPHPLFREFIAQALNYRRRN
ncbi:MAG TPA: CTP synthase, partial [Moorella mulderi]|nr:CTP synthase [Moorella mulderi]